MSFESLRHIVSKTVRNPQTSRDLQIARIFDVARVVLGKLWGDERAAYVTPVSFKEGILKFDATAPAAKQQMSIDLPRIRNEINRQLGDAIVKNIVVHGKGF